MFGLCWDLARNKYRKKNTKIFMTRNAKYAFSAEHFTSTTLTHTRSDANYAFRRASVSDLSEFETHRQTARKAANGKHEHREEEDQRRCGQDKLFYNVLKT